MALLFVVLWLLERCETNVMCFLSRVPRGWRMDTGPPMGNVAKFAFTCVFVNMSFGRFLLSQTHEEPGEQGEFHDGGIWPRIWSYSTINIPPCFSEVWWPFACCWPRTVTLQLQRSKVKRKFLTVTCSRAKIIQTSNITEKSLVFFFYSQKQNITQEVRFNSILSKMF